MSKKIQEQIKIVKGGILVAKINGLCSVELKRELETLTSQLIFIMESEIQ